MQLMIIIITYLSKQQIESFFCQKVNTSLINFPQFAEKNVNSKNHVKVQLGQTPK